MSNAAWRSPGEGRSPAGAARGAPGEGSGPEGAGFRQPAFVQWSWSAGRRSGWLGALLSVLVVAVLASFALALVAAAVVLLAVGIGVVLVKRLWSGPAVVRGREDAPWVVFRGGEPADGTREGTILDAEWREVSSDGTAHRLPGRSGGG